MPPVLTEQQQKDYYATQSNAATPLSPLDWLSQQNKPAPKPETVPKEVTTLSDTNIRENVKPQMDKKLDKFAESGRYEDQNGNVRNADGSIADDENEYDKAVQSINDEASASEEAIINTLRAKVDADTARMVESIQQQYAVRKQQQADINMRSEASVDTALLLGGTSRYAISGNDISAAQRSYGVQQLASLDAEEKSLIAQAKAAQTEFDYQLLERNLEQIEIKRQEKLAKAKEVAERMTEENNKLRESKMKMETEISIADLFKQGIDDPADIQSMLSAQGLTADLGMIDDTLAIINPPAELADIPEDIQTFKMFFPEADIGTPDGRQLWLDWTQAIKNAQQVSKPSDQYGDAYQLGDSFVQRNEATGEIRRVGGLEKPTGGAGGEDSVLTPEEAENTLRQIQFMKQNLTDAASYAHASGRSGARRTAEAFLVGSTDYTNLEAVSNSLRTNVLTLVGDPAVRKFFGPQMSEADVKLMTAGGTTLNPELQSPQQMTDEIERLSDLINRIEQSIVEGQTQQTSGGGGGVLRSPDGTQEVDISELTPEQIKEAQDAGWK